MPENKKHNSPSDFLHDDSFLRWQLFHSKEETFFWETFIIHHPEKEEHINAAIKTLHTMKMNHFTLSSDEAETLLNDIKGSIKKKRKTKIIRFISSAAASIVLFVTCFSLFFSHPAGQKKDLITSKNTGQTLNNKDIQLILANKETMVFDKDATIQYDKGYITVNSGNNSSSIKIDNAKNKFNKLIVPKGKRSNLTLSDGTKIWINSGTILEYPTEFDKKKREIRIDGEIYLEVAKNEQQPFFVNMPTFSVEVLGTRFNVSAYSEDTDHSVVLVEGSVKVKTNANKEAMLEPDQILQIFPNFFEAKKVNVYDYISWKDGLLQFKSEPLSQILNRLERYYDIQFSCEPKIQNLRCTGKLVLFDDLDKVLSTITNTIPIKYSKSESMITINQK